VPPDDPPGSPILSTDRTPSQPDGPKAALERLAAALDPRDHATTLVVDPGQMPYLTVASRHAGLTEDVYADQRSFWWSWAEPICAVDDALTAAQKITSVLRPAPQATRG
jgi:hypothetical protein